MNELHEGMRALHRIEMLVRREEVAEALGHAETCSKRREALFELAICGWTEEAFICEAWDWNPDA